jgi:phage/plasmid-associated DNA primase
MGAILGKAYNAPDARNIVGENESAFIGTFRDMSRTALSILSELPTNCHLNETLIKKITGNDAITKEKKGKEESLTIRFLCKLIILFNWDNVPRVSSEDVAFWDRVVCLYFPARFADIDAGVKAKLTTKYKNNLDIFFSYFVEGAKKWYANKNLTKVLPEKIKINTEKFKSLRDIYARFITETCDLGDNLTQDKEHLYNAFLSWAKRMNIYGKKEEVIGRNKFYDIMIKKGFGTVRVGGDSIRCFGGLKLKTINNDTEQQAQQAQTSSIFMNTERLLEPANFE